MIDLKKLGYEKEKYGKTEQGVPARVTAVHRERYEVISAQGESFARCRASAYRNCRAADYPTVGDFVELLPAENSDGWILRTLPRQTVFTRTNLHGHAAKFVKNIDEQAVAANFDWVWIVQSLNHNFSLSRLERYLALTRSSGARAAPERRVPPQSGHGPSRRYFATRAKPFSSFAFSRAFSTVRTALK